MSPFANAVLINAKICLLLQVLRGSNLLSVSMTAGAFGLCMLRQSTQVRMAMAEGIMLRYVKSEGRSVLVFRAQKPI